MTNKVRIRFTRDEVEERAWADKKRGGYERVRVPAGTIREATPRSVDYWRRRGSVEVLGPVDPELNPFAFVRPSEPPADEPQKLTKKAISTAVGAAAQAISDQNIPGLADALEVLCDERVADVLPDVTDDTKLVLSATLDDARAGTVSVHPQEIVDALEQVRQLTLPPSRRTG